MPTPKSAWFRVDLGLQGASTATKEALVGMAGTIKEIWVGTAVLPSTATVALAKAGVNLLSATNVNVAALTAGVAASQTLASSEATLKVAAADVLKATWTISSAGSFVGGSVIVWIEPDQW